MSTFPDLQTQPDPVADTDSNKLRAGVAKSEITTNESGILINDPLWAKALVLDDGATKLAIIAMDVTAIGGIGDVSDEFLPKLRQRVETELGIPGRNILVNASHTHPPGRLLCDDEQQISRTFDAVKRAWENMSPVTVGSGSGHEDRIMMNRNLRLKNGKYWTVRHAYSCPPDEEVESVGPTDPEIGILRIDHIDGRPLAILFNFAGHPIFSDPTGSVTADYPGFASKVIEDNLGEGTMALFLQGAGGDIVDVHFKDFDQTRSTKPLGLMLGLSTLKALKPISTGNTSLSIISETVELPRRTDFPERIEALRQEQSVLLKSLRSNSLNFKSFLPLYLKHALNPEFPSHYSYNYLQAEGIGNDKLAAMDAFNKAKLEKYLDGIFVMEKLSKIEDEIATFERHQAINDESGEATITAEVIGIKIGDCVLISAPLEVLTEVALNVKGNSPYEHTFMTAFSNGYMHYGPPASDYDKGGYETNECFLAPEWQAIYEAKAREIICRL